MQTAAGASSTAPRSRETRSRSTGKVVEGARVVTSSSPAPSPAAPQVAIKQSGTNGGGFFGVNSAHPYENPSAFTNIIEMTSLLLIPAACCFTFGIGVKNTKQGKATFAAMFILLVIFTGVIAVNEHAGTPQLADSGAVNIEMTDAVRPGGNGGKENASASYLLHVVGLHHRRFQRLG